MSAQEDLTLSILIDRIRVLVGASAGWVVAKQSDATRVVAVSGDVGMIRVGSIVDGGSASYVASSGQPLALAPRQGDAFVEQGAVALLGRIPTALISLPCLYADDVVGAVEIVDKVEGARFSLDDLEIGGRVRRRGGRGARGLPWRCCRGRERRPARRRASSTRARRLRALPIRFLGSRCPAVQWLRVSSLHTPANRKPFDWTPRSRSTTSRPRGRGEERPGLECG